MPYRMLIKPSAASRRPALLAALTTTVLWLPSAAGTPAEAVEPYRQTIPIPRFRHMDPAEAVRAAHALERPDAGGMIADAAAHKDEVLGGFGSGDLSLVRREESYWQDGQGKLFAPSVNRVVACRSADDPECLAVQELDKGFPERPPVPDDAIHGRDEVVNGSGGEIPGVSTGEGCRAFVIETKPVVEEEVCRAGSPFAQSTCDAGWKDAATLASLWACRKTQALEKTFACRVPVDFSTTPQHAERCFFGEDALKPEHTVTVRTEASASAVFPALCTAPQMTYEKLSCAKTLEVTGTPSCTIGETTKSTTQGPPWLFEDACRAADTLTIEHACEKVAVDRSRTLTFTLNGFAPVKTRGTASGTIRASDGVCTAKYKIESHTCSGTDCLIRMSVTVYNGAIVQGTIEALHPYLGYTAGGALVDQWTNGCEAFEGKHGTPSNGMRARPESER